MKESSAPPSSVKKEKAPTQSAGGGDAGEPVPSMIDLRVGKIVQGSFHCSFWYRKPQPSLSAVERHPDADGLYVEVGAFVFMYGDVVCTASNKSCAANRYWRGDAKNCCFGPGSLHPNRAHAGPDDHCGGKAN